MAFDLNRLQRGVESEAVQIAKLRNENESLRDVFNEIRSLLLPTNFEARLQKKMEQSHWTAEALKPPSPKKSAPSSPSKDGNTTEAAKGDETDATAEAEASNPKGEGKGKGKSKAEKKKQKRLVNNMSLSERIFHDRIELMRSGQGGDPMSQQLGQLEERLSTIASALRNSPNLDSAMQVQRPPDMVKKEKARRRSAFVEVESEEEDSDKAADEEEVRTNGVADDLKYHVCWECKELRTKGFTDYDDKNWYCENCWKECRSDYWNAATKIGAVARGNRERKEVSAKKESLKLEKEAKKKQTEKVAQQKSSDKGPDRRQSGSWTQWPRKSLQNGKLPVAQEESTVKKSGKPTTELSKPLTPRQSKETTSAAAEKVAQESHQKAAAPQLCGDCGEKKLEGKFDDDGDWFCTECWKAVEAGEESIALEDPEMTEGPPQMCGDCQEMRTRGKSDEDGDWFCEACWAKVGEDDEEEEEEEVIEGGPRQCGDCGLMKTTGEIDPDTEDWFCTECWAAVEAAED